MMLGFDTWYLTDYVFKLDVAYLAVYCRRLLDNMAQCLVTQHEYEYA